MLLFSTSETTCEHGHTPLSHELHHVAGIMMCPPRSGCTARALHHPKVRAGAGDVAVDRPGPQATTAARLGTTKGGVHRTQSMATCAKLTGDHNAAQRPPLRVLCSVANLYSHWACMTAVGKQLQAWGHSVQYLCSAEEQPWLAQLGITDASQLLLFPAPGPKGEFFVRPMLELLAAERPAAAELTWCAVRTPWLRGICTITWTKLCTSVRWAP